ncbi:MAG: AAA family ATPase [Gammaproteobacteria bacterium]|nr:AAA family ATPase [Gammaproteobacteria bacterium]
MKSLRISLLGAFHVTLDDEPVTDFDSDKVRALLAYLTVEVDRPHRREKLAGLFWPELSERRARANLSQALFSLRKAIGDREADPPFLLITPSAIQFDSKSDHHLDVATFTMLLAECDAHSHRRLENCPACLERLKLVAACYQGNFLADFSLSDCPAVGEWVVFHQEHFHHQAMEALHHLGRGHAQLGTYEIAYQYAGRAVELEPTWEGAHRDLMRLLALNGQRTAALAQYETCRSRLVDELGIEPEKETVTLYKQIQTGELRAPASIPDLEPAIPLQVPGFLQAETDEIDKPIFVARERELARLETFLDAALGGTGQVAFVIGGPGRGKTALLNEFARRAMGIHPTLLVASGNCNVYSGVGDPCLPFRELMLMLTGEVEDRWATGAITLEHAKRLWATIPETVLTLLERGPDVIRTLMPGTALLSRAAAAAPTSAPWLQRLREYTERQQRNPESLDQSQFFQQITDVLRCLAETHPLILILDNLQWADAASTGLLFHLGRRLENTRILIACAYRPEEVALGRDGERHPLEKMVNEFKLQYGDVLMDLSQIGEAEGRGFVNAVLETEANLLSEGFRQTLYQYTEGHPLFTIELLRAMQARGDLRQDEEGRWVEGAALDWERLPARVEGVIEERVGRLEAELRDTLTIASVEGEDFTTQVVARVQDIDERRLLQALSLELEKRHRLVREQAGLHVGQKRLSRYRFAHALFQRYLYNNISDGERRLLHREVAGVLEDLHKGNTEKIAVQLAHHYSESANSERALEYLILAGDAAADLFAHAEVRLHFTRALEILSHLPDTVENRRQRVDTIIKLTASAWRSDSPEENLARLSEAERLTQKLSSPDEEPSDDHLRLVRIHFWMGRVHQSGGSLREAIKYFQQILPAAQELDDPELLAIPSYVIGTVMNVQARFDQSLLLLQQAIPFFEQTSSWSEWIRAVALSGGMLCGMGEYKKGLAEVKRAQTKAQEFGSLSEIALCLVSLSYAYFFGGDLPRSINAARQTVKVAERSGDRIYIYLGYSIKGWAEARAKQYEAAAESTSQAQAIAEELDGQVVGADYLAAANVEIAYGTGQIEKAIKLAKQTVSLCQKIDAALGDGAARRVWGQALAALSPPHWPDAETQLAESLRVFESAHIWLEAARTHVAWGAVCRGRRDTLAARAHWVKAAAQFEKSGLARELEQARDLLSSIW